MGSLKHNIYLLTLGDVRRSLRKTNARGFTKRIKAARERKVIIMFLSVVLVLCGEGVAESVFGRVARVLLYLASDKWLHVSEGRVRGREKKRKMYVYN